MGKSPPLRWVGEKSFATSGVMHLTLGVQDYPLASGQEKCRLQHLEL